MWLCVQSDLNPFTADVITVNWVIEAAFYLQNENKIKVLSKCSHFYTLKNKRQRPCYCDCDICNLFPYLATNCSNQVFIHRLRVRHSLDNHFYSQGNRTNLIMGGNLSPNNRDPASAGYSYSQTGEGVQKNCHLIYKCRRIANTSWSICQKTPKKNKLIDWLIQFSCCHSNRNTVFW